MEFDDDLGQWLQTQPLDTRVEIDGEQVYLKVHPDGAELGGYVLQSCSPAQLQHALKSAFQSAMQFDAGLARAPDSGGLVLTQWLPYANGWPDAAEALESLLNALSYWRVALAPSQVLEMDNKSNRNEQRLRSLYERSL